jgi:hypothetical protein
MPMFDRLSSKPWWLPLAATLAVILWPQVAKAQAESRSSYAGVHLAGWRLGEFGNNEPGVGGRTGRHLNEFVGLEAELTLFPSERRFSRRRTELLAGVLLGWRTEHAGYFGKIRPGFVHFARAPDGLVCIQIIPTPSQCLYQTSGKAELALDLGGVVEIYPSPRSTIRFDFSNYLLRIDREVAPLTTQNLRISVGGGWRF